VPREALPNLQFPPADAALIAKLATQD
jgi:hypothetical protein